MYDLSHLGDGDTRTRSTGHSFLSKVLITEGELARRLEKYLPAGTPLVIARWVVQSGVHLRITMPRNSRYGDYMHPWQGKGHRISINGNLNQFAFLVTMVHEFAHLNVWEEWQNRVKPHGSEWKQAFQLLMEPFLKEAVFPEDVTLALRQYMQNPQASSCTDTRLMKTLKKYDREQAVFLEEIPENSHFIFNERMFVKGPRQRTRYKCREVDTNQHYLIGPTAEIQPLN